MWTVLTYAYNSILIIFIATHLIVGAIISFLVGLYIGVYLCQNYELPIISEPSKLWGKLAVFMEQYRKNPNRSKLDFIKPSTILSIIKAEDEVGNHLAITTQNDDDQDDYNYEFGDGEEASPTLILTDPDFNDFDKHGRPRSQILEASLVLE